MILIKWQIAANTNDDISNLKESEYLIYSVLIILFPFNFN